jgi:hypothetical protein
MPLQATSGAASYDAFGGVAAVPQYIEDIFSCFLYTGNGSTQTITNGIDLSGKGGLVWIKNRSRSTSGHLFADTVSGRLLSSSGNQGYWPATSGGYGNSGSSAVIFGGSGFSLGADTAHAINNYYTTDKYASLTFRKQPKFFDVVTYTGTGANRTVSHNLGSVPGCIIVKRTDTTADWQVYHRSLANTEYLVLNTTDAKATGSTRWNSTTPTSTVFSLGTDTTVNASGGTYVAYLFAHDAGGFGLSGSDNVISCGGYTGNPGVRVDINLGYEPQWLLVKRASDIDQWVMADVMRGIPTGSADPIIYADSSAAENSGGGDFLNVSPTGFYTTSGNNAVNGASTYIYIAIRRGPMKTPTSGTEVLSLTAGAGTSAARTVSTSCSVVDFAWLQNTGGSTPHLYDRLRGKEVVLEMATGTSAEYAFGGNGFDVNGGFKLTGVSDNSTSANYLYWFMKRAPGFFDVVCYTGNGTTLTLSHNLTVPPELFIIKCRDGVTNWSVPQTMISGGNSFIALNSSSAMSTVGAGTILGNNVSYVAPTSTAFTLGSQVQSNNSGLTYVAYLFATVAGVSKVGSYTGTGTTKQIDCGFTAGARFVLIKRTDSTGDWYVWDSARGIVAGNDPYLLLNSTAAEVTGTDYVDTYSAGFELSSTAPAAINAIGGTFIFLAIA